MLHLRPSISCLLHHYQIEPVFVFRPAVPQQPDSSDPGDIPLFPPAYRFVATPAAIGAPGLHLDEGHDIALADDEIHVMPAQPKPVCFHRPAAGREIGEGNVLAFETEDLALIFPLGHRHKPSDYAHEFKLCA
jgi:hypothetical protein